MRLLPLEEPQLLETAAAWLTREDVAPWIAFTDQAGDVTPRLLKVLTQHDSHELRAYTDDDGRRAIGIVGLSELSAARATANLWFALGDRSRARRGHTTLAARMMLDVAFEELDLATVSAWVVEHNVSRRILERLGFRRVGRRRRCHPMDGRLYDRILYDLLAEEHRESRHVA